MGIGPFQRVGLELEMHAYRRSLLSDYAREDAIRVGELLRSQVSSDLVNYNAEWNEAQFLVPCSTHEVLKDGVEEGIGMIMTDAGFHTVELATRPFSSFEELSDILSEFPRVMKSLLPGAVLMSQGIERFFDRRDAKPPRWCLKPRYNAIWSALKREVGEERYKGVLTNSLYASTQFHFEVDPYSQRGVRLMRYLNNWAPAVWQVCAWPRNNNRLGRAWTGWGNPIRMPGPDTWNVRTVKEFVDLIRKVPHLIRMRKDGSYVPYVYDHKAWDIRDQRMLPSTYWGSVYWDCRPRPDIGPGTIEFRPLDSLPLRLIPTALRFVVKVCERILGDVELPMLDTPEWSELREGNRRKQAVEFLSQIVPAETIPDF